MIDTIGYGMTSYEDCRASELEGMMCLFLDDMTIRERAYIPELNHDAAGSAPLPTQQAHMGCVHYVLNNL